MPVERPVISKSERLGEIHSQGQRMFWDIGHRVTVKYLVTGNQLAAAKIKIDDLLVRSSFSISVGVTQINRSCLVDLCIQFQFNPDTLSFGTIQHHRNEPRGEGIKL